MDITVEQGGPLVDLLRALDRADAVERLLRRLFPACSARPYPDARGNVMLAKVQGQEPAIDPAIEFRTHAQALSALAGAQLATMAACAYEAAQAGFAARPFLGFALNALRNPTRRSAWQELWARVACQSPTPGQHADLTDGIAQRLWHLHAWVGAARNAAKEASPALSRGDEAEIEALDDRLAELTVPGAPWLTLGYGGMIAHASAPDDQLCVRPMPCPEQSRHEGRREHARQDPALAAALP